MSGRRRAQIVSKAVRRARSAQSPQSRVQQPEPAAVPLPEQTRPAPVAEPRKRLDTKVLVHALHVAYPSMGVDTIADKLGVNERTVRRHLPAPDVHLEHANGSQV